MSDSKHLERMKAPAAKRETSLEFSVNEQNALTMLSELASSLNYLVQTNPELAYDRKEYYGERLIDILERFPSTDWSSLYDRFHRQGKNA